MGRAFRRATDREDGVAMVTALLVAFVVFLLSVAVIRQAIHNLDASGYDGRRLRSISAAEAGLNWAYNQLEVTDIAGLWTGTDGTPLELDVGSGPVSVEVDVAYYADADGTVAYDPDTATASNPPASLKIVSTGSTPAGVERRMESFALLHAVYGGLDGAVIAYNDVNLTNNFNLQGNSGNDGDIVVEDGNFSAPSGVEQIRGTIYVRDGTALLGTNTHVYGSIWANGTVTLGHPQARVDGDVKSSTGATTITQGSVGGSAYYCTTITNPSKVAGTKVQTCDLGPPPTFGFPYIRFSQAAWQDEGFYVKDFGSGASACTNALSWLSGTGPNTYNQGTPINGGLPVGGDHTGAAVVMRGCEFEPGPAFSTMRFGTDLAIVSTGGSSSSLATSAVTLGQSTSWQGLGGTRDLFFFSPYDGTTRHCSASDGTQDVVIGNLNQFTSTNVSVYTPCLASVSNNNTFPGQIIGYQTTIQGNFTMSYRPVLIPGTDIVGFEQDVAYIREVAA